MQVPFLYSNCQSFCTTDAEMNFSFKLMCSLSFLDKRINISFSYFSFFSPSLLRLRLLLLIYHHRVFLNIFFLNLIIFAAVLATQPFGFFNFPKEIAILSEMYVSVFGANMNATKSEVKCHQKI